VFWARRGDDLLLTIRLTPNSGADRIDGPRILSDGKAVLAARVRAIPEDGAANEALCKLIAKTADLPKSRVSIVSGHTSRVKIIRIEGDDAAIRAAIGMIEAAGGK
jgi:uncharacterized protein